MEDKSKLYVFDKKEIFLIFIFMVFIAITFFALGVRIGKNYSYEQAGYTASDKEKIDFLSNQEEEVKKVVEEQEKVGVATDKKLLDTTYEKLKQEFNQLDEKKSVKDDETVDGKSIHDEKEEILESAGSPVTQDKFAGKYSIQLSSHRQLKEAENFADGFKVRGYNPIISEAQIKGRGTWYRVSIGVFDTVSDAKNYILAEKALFQGQDYSFLKFD